MSPVFLCSNLICGVRNISLVKCHLEQDLNIRQGGEEDEKDGYSACFGSTYTKIGTIQRRLAWPPCKDDTQVCEVKKMVTDKERSLYEGPENST